MDESTKEGNGRDDDDDDDDDDDAFLLLPYHTILLLIITIPYYDCRWTRAPRRGASTTCSTTSTEPNAT